MQIQNVNLDNKAPAIHADNTSFSLNAAYAGAAAAPSANPQTIQAPDFADFAIDTASSLGAATVGILSLTVFTGGGFPLVALIATGAALLIREVGHAIVDHASGDPEQQTSAITDMLNGGSFDWMALGRDVAFSAATGVSTIATFGATSALTRPLLAAGNEFIGGLSGKILGNIMARAGGAAVGAAIGGGINLKWTKFELEQDGLTEEEETAFLRQQINTGSQILTSGLIGGVGALFSLSPRLSTQIIGNFCFDYATAMGGEALAAKSEGRDLDGQSFARAALTATQGVVLNIGGHIAATQAAAKPIGVERLIAALDKANAQKDNSPPVVRFPPTIDAKPILVVGKSYRDITLAGLHEMPGPDTRVSIQDVIQTVIAGNAPTAGYTAAKLGARVEFLVTVPEGYPGDAYRRKAFEYGIKIHERPVGHESTSIVLPVGETRTYLIDRKDDYTGPIPKLDVTKYSALHIDGRQSVAAIEYARLFHEAGLPVFFDGSSVQKGVTEHILQHATYPVVAPEFARQIGQQLGLAADAPMPEVAVATLRYLKQQGAKAAAVTLGSQGSIYITPEDDIGFLPTLDIRGRIVNTGNAGDITHGSLLYTFVANPDFTWREHMIFARAVATHSITQMHIEDKLPNVSQVRTVMEYIPENPIPEEWLPFSNN